MERSLFWQREEKSLSYIGKDNFLRNLDQDTAQTLLLRESRGRNFSTSKRCPRLESSAQAHLIAITSNSCLQNWHAILCSARNKCSVCSAMDSVLYGADV